MKERETTDAQIESLLATDEEMSVIDALMAMPRVPVADEKDVWHKVFHARLQKRLSRKLRAEIDRQRGNIDEDDV